jgi:hypothetical protein
LFGSRSGRLTPAHAAAAGRNNNASITNSSSSYNTFVVNAIRCNVSETHVEVAVHCAAPTRGACRATRVRRSCVDRRPAERTPLDFYPMRYYVARGMASGFGNSGDGLTSSET